MLDQREYERLALQFPPPPAMLEDYRTVWNYPERAGDVEGVKNAREIRSRYPGKYMERMAVLEAEWLRAVTAVAEMEAARLKAMTPVSAVAGGQTEQIPDEGTARAREIGEQVLRGLGLPEVADEDNPR